MSTDRLWSDDPDDFPETGCAIELGDRLAVRSLELSDPQGTAIQDALRSTAAQSEKVLCIRLHPSPNDSVPAEHMLAVIQADFDRWAVRAWRVEQGEWDGSEEWYALMVGPARPDIVLAVRVDAVLGALEENKRTGIKQWIYGELVASMKMVDAPKAARDPGFAIGAFGSGSSILSRRRPGSH